MCFGVLFTFRMGLTGLEPVTPRLSSVCSNQLSYRPFWIIPKAKFRFGGAEEIRTPDILLAKQALYQLSYSPVKSFLSYALPGAPNTELCDIKVWFHLKGYLIAQVIDLVKQPRKTVHITP